ELNHSQNVGATQLSCKSSKIWEHGTSLMNYLRMFNSKGQRSNYALRIMQHGKDGLRQCGLRASCHQMSLRQVYNGYLPGLPPLSESQCASSVPLDGCITVLGVRGEIAIEMDPLLLDPRSAPNAISPRSSRGACVSMKDSVTPVIPGFNGLPASNGRRTNLRSQKRVFLKGPCVWCDLTTS
ncbi:hypothetical protein NHX12_007967, partial [Muraenolepis orangiensis]